MPALPPLVCRLACISAVGAIMMYGSEILFWSVPPANTTAQELALTWMAYSLCSAVFVGLLARFRVSDWRGLFLCGSIFGWLVEGVIVGEMYQEFPYQLIWTPLAWHALITALGMFWLVRVSAEWTVRAQIVFVAVMGLYFGLWALWWPIERQPMPGMVESVFYLIGLAAFPVAAQFVIDRWGWSLLDMTRAELGIAAFALAGIWLTQVHAAPKWLHLTLPMLLALTLWMLERQPAGPPMKQRWVAVRASPVRHGLFMIMPAITCLTACIGWSLGFAPPSNEAVFLLTVAASALIYLDCLRRAWRS